MNKFNQIKEEIRETIKNSKSPHDSEHSITCLKWLLKINPNVSEEAQLRLLPMILIEQLIQELCGKKAKNLMQNINKGMH